MRWTITVNHEICVGSGTCTALAPELFALNDEDRATPVTADAERDQIILDAAQMCPTGAISVHVTGTGQPIWPAP